MGLRLRGAALVLAATALAAGAGAAQEPERVPAEPIPVPAEPIPVPEAVPADTLAPPLPILQGTTIPVETPGPWVLEWPGWRGITIERYNRTDGLVPGFGVSLEPVDPAKTPEIEVRLAAATTRERVYWWARVRQRLPLARPAWIEAEHYHRPETFDDWKLSPRENDIASFLVGSDLLDWWRERGLRLGAEVESWDGDAAVGLAFRSVRQHSQRNRSPFVLFGGDDDFRDNPPILEGVMHGLVLSGRWDSRDIQSPLLPAPGWLVTGEIEKAGGPLGGDVEFLRGMLDVRRYVRFGRDTWWDTRLVWLEGDGEGGTPGEDPLPPQRHAMLGGPGSLRGFRAASFVGSDALQVNSEFRLPLPVADAIALFFLNWHWVAFVDAGAVDDFGEWHADVGTGISGINIFTYVGVFVAQQVTDLGGGDDGPRFVVRLRRDI